MSSESKSSASAGIGFSGVLQITFIVLKLCGVIDWSWWAVFIPTLINIGILVVFIIVLWIGWMRIKR